MLFSRHSRKVYENLREEIKNRGLSGKIEMDYDYKNTISLKCAEDMEFEPFYWMLTGVFEKLIGKGFDFQHNFPDENIDQSYFFSKKSFLEYWLCDYDDNYGIRINFKINIPGVLAYTEIPKDKQTYVDKEEKQFPLFTTKSELLNKKAHYLNLLRFGRVTGMGG
jgi:hypothetical protein